MSIELTGDPSDQYISCGSGSTIDDIFAAGGTIALWIKPDDFGTAGTAGIAVKGDGNDGWTFLISSSGLFLEKNGTANGNWAVTSILSTGVWQHIVVTYSYALTTNDPIFYLNGVAQALSTDTNGSGYDSDAAHNFRWGDWQIDVNARFFDGQMEDMRAYKRILTADEIAVLSAGYRGSMDGEVLWLSGDDFMAVAHPDGATLTAVTNNLPDLSGNGNDGVPTNSPVARASDAPRFRPEQWWAGFTSIISQAVGGTLTTSGILTKFISKLSVGAITPVGITTKLTIKNVFDGSLPLSGVLSKVIYKNVSGQLTPIGALLKQLLEFFIMRLDTIIAADGHIDITPENEDR